MHKSTKHFGNGRQKTNRPKISLILFVIFFIKRGHISKFRVLWKNPSTYGRIKINNKYYKLQIIVNIHDIFLVCFQIVINVIFVFLIVAVVPCFGRRDARL